MRPHDFVPEGEMTKGRYRSDRDGDTEEEMKGGKSRKIHDNLHVSRRGMTASSTRV